MKKLLIALAVSGALCAGAAEIKFEETPGIFPNPGQGFSCISLWFNPKTKVNYGAGYMRFEWAKL
jgi:hypothetical protein